MAGNAAPPPLSDTQRQHWNLFLDYVQKQGYKGSKALDNRNMQLGQGLLTKFNQMNPGSTIRYEDVPAIQGALQAYRNDLVSKWKSGKAEGTPDIKSEEDIMGGISPVDGWLGSKTSNWKFPTASFTNSAGQVQNFGTNTQAYDTVMQNKK